MSTQSEVKTRGVIEFHKLYKPMLAILIPGYAYTLLRYTINNHEPVYDLPFYLLNKSLGFTSAVMIALAYLIGPMVNLSQGFRPFLGHRKYLGMGGFLLGSGHGIMSAILLAGSNYSSFYDSATHRLNIYGSLSMLFGTIAIVHFGFLAIISIPAVMKSMDGRQWKRLQRGGLVGLAVTFLHIASFGVLSWFDLKKWYGGMPPYSLVSAGAIVLLVAARYGAMALGNATVRDPRAPVPHRQRGSWQFQWQRIVSFMFLLK